MTKTLFYIAIVALIATLVSALIAIWTEKASAVQFINLTRELLSWKVIAGGLTAGTGVTFKKEIGSILGRLGKQG